MIEHGKCGCIARTKKQNEIIDALNPLLKIQLVNGERLDVLYSDNNVFLTIPEASGMPDGSAGDILYHDGSDWVSLSAPSAPGDDAINLLTHNGTAPAWVTKDIEEISVCESGSPTTWDIIKM